MATTVDAPPRGIPHVADFREPKWFERVPEWARVTGALVVLVALSAYLRAHYIGGQLWEDETITTGIASHPLSAIPGILRHDGSPPLFYVLLHFWIQIFGYSEVAIHGLSLLIGLLTIPIGMWAGWSLFGKRAGYYAAVLFAFSTFLTAYADEARMYELMGLLGLLGAASFLHAFVFRRRRYLVLLAITEALMLYTHAWGMFFGAGAVVALIPIYRVTAVGERRALVRDAVLAFGGAGILFLPWLPNFIYQATHTGAPWAPPPRLGTPVLLSRDLMGGDRITTALVIGTVIGIAPLFTRARRRSREAIAMWTLIALPAATLLLAWLASQITPAFVSRYFAPILASILLLAALGAARAGIVGLVAVGLSCIFVANLSSYAPKYKSDMRDVGGEVAPLVQKGDVALFSQPDSTPLGWYYFPSGLRYSTTLGPVSDPSYMNWVYALRHLRATNAGATITPLLASLRPGQHLLFVRPLTEGAKNWQAPWTQLVRRRSAQLGALLEAQVKQGKLKVIAWAPHNYPGASILADSAVLYEKTRK